MLATYFSNYGAEVHLLTWTEENKPKEFPFLVIRKPELSLLIKEFLWAEIVFENNPCLKLSWPALFLPKKHFIVLHTWIRSAGKINMERLKRLWLKKASKVFAVSQKLRDGISPRALVIKNSYDHQLFRRLPEIDKTEDFVFLGRLVSDKGADMAIMLLKLLNRSFGIGGSLGRFSLSIIGDGPERSYLEKMVKDYRMEAYIHFTGALSGQELVTTLNKHKYILVPSRWKEPFGLVALEGMACGCLPIVSDGGGLPEAVGDAGVVFDRNDVFSLFEEVKRLMEKPDLEKEIRSRFSRHLNNHTSDVVCRQYFQAISENLILNEKQASDTFSSNR